MDGSLTGQGAGSWAISTTFDHGRQPHLVTPECQESFDTYDGVICDNTVQVRTVSFGDAWSPNSLRMMWAKVALWDEEVETAMEADEQTLFDFQQDVDH